MKDPVKLFVHLLAWLGIFLAGFLIFAIILLDSAETRRRYPTGEYEYAYRLPSVWRGGF